MATSKEGNILKAEKLRLIANEPPIIRIVKTTIERAIEDGASKIHIVAKKRELAISYTLEAEGGKVKVMSMPQYILSAVRAQFKVVAGIDIAATGDQTAAIEYQTFLDDIVLIKITVREREKGEVIMVEILQKGSDTDSPTLRQHSGK